MRLAYYAGASTAAAAACLLKAFHQRPNFYSATVYLSQSNACILILTNLLLVAACSFMYGLQRLLYGPLRPIEIEQLSEKAWYAVLDTLLAMPSFREDVGGWLLTMFVLLLAGKVWGWIGEGRVDILEQQPPANPRLFHARLATSLVSSVLFDMWMLDYCVETVMADPRPGMMVIFTFEFAILSIFSMFTLSRYCLTLVQMRIEAMQMKEAIEVRKTEIRSERAAARQQEMTEGRPTPALPPNEEPIEVDENEVDVPGWEEKRRYLFALEVFTDFVKLVIYIVFFIVSITFNGLPMHIMRDVYMTFASFSKRVSDYLAYRKATSDMNTRYPDATTEEIRGDACIVCRENMVAWALPNEQAQGGQQQAVVPTPAVRRDEGLRAKKLPCGHILHLRCLKAWLERQQVCPTCRRPVVSVNEGTAGQPGAPGAAPGAPRQPGQQPPPRQNRARIFNFGPLRIGLANIPVEELQQMANRVRNPGAQNGGALPADQQGPNHLGLRVPYLPNGANGQPATRAAVPTQIQIMQIEHRLLQEAHNLGVEQQQLATLRMMEAELGRLRANVISAQQPVGITGAGAQRPQMGVHAPGMPFMPFGQTIQGPETLQGFAAQEIGMGHAQLPHGMVLPEGWTLMPLQRVDGGVAHGTAGIANGVAGSANGVAFSPMQAGQATTQPPVPGSTNGTTSVQETQPQPPTSTSQPTQNVDIGPTDERGSPLFTPTPTAPATNGTAPTTQQATTTTSQPPTEAAAPASNPAQPPWAPSIGWTLPPPNGDSTPNGHHAEYTAVAAAKGTEAVTESANGGPAENSAGQGYSGKGKGKAVEVEDVVDEKDG